jgi:hypothetical protein
MWASRWLGSHPTAAIMAFSLALACTVREGYALMSAVGVTLPVSWIRCSNHWNTLASGWCRTRMLQHVFPHSSTSLTITATKDLEHVTVFVCTFHDHSITTDPCCVLCILCTPNALCICVTYNTAEKYVTLFDGDVYLKNQESQDML